VVVVCSLFFLSLYYLTPIAGCHLFSLSCGRLARCGGIVFAFLWKAS
jgi:hypothetical protein